jgi:internalin A
MARHRARSSSASGSLANTIASDPPNQTPVLALPPPACPLRLFFIYSRKDKDLRNQLEVHLKLLQRNGVILPWHDSLIGAGQEWEAEISKNLEQADIVLPLISADSLASDYCFEIEFSRAIERHKAGDAKVIPVFIRDADLTDAPFRQIQWLPSNGRAVTRWANRDAAWRDVAQGIRMAAMELQRVKRSQSA